MVVGTRGGNAGDVKVWPLPYSVSHGQKKMYMSGDFKLLSHGSKFSDASGILKDGFARFVDLLKLAHAVDGNVSKLQYGVDESYKLLVPSPEMPAYAQIEVGPTDPFSNSYF
ncbi:hypothetical protein Pint_11668 [Pistacia integerrima]|uniref:Uncharacterized protein n=1 Tax=Pistacia integerrima TaxID=434235 RepID=A0ACC0XKT8_9ROSI|nr:hypothetical protein Pint_11668 [Pistacia integerrima]